MNFSSLIHKADECLFYLKDSHNAALTLYQRTKQAQYMAQAKRFRAKFSAVAEYKHNLTTRSQQWKQ